MSALVSTISNWLTRSLENPSTSLSDPDDFLFDAFGARRADSGVRVNRRTALMYAAVKRAVDMLSRDVSKLPLNVFRRTGETSREKDTSHPAYPLLRWKPNSEMVVYKWLSVVMNHVLLEGNSYSFILRDGVGRPLEILPLNPDVTKPVQIDGQFLFVTKVDDKDRFIDPEDMIHIIGVSFDGKIGIRLIDIARDSFGYGIAMERYGSKFFANSARPNVVLEHPETLSPEAQKKLRISFDRLNSGLDNSHRTAVLFEGMKLKAFSINAKDAQLMEAMNWNVKQIANWFNLPTHKLGDDSKTSFASLEQENQSYLNEAVDPWLVLIEQVLRDRLLTEREKREDSHFIEFNRNALVRADIKARGEFYRISLGGAPFMTRNEVRARENLNEVEGGDEILDPLNMSGDVSTTEPEENRRTESEEEQRKRNDEMTSAMSREYTLRCLGRLQVHAERAAKEPRKFLAWIDNLQETNREKLEAIYPVVLRKEGIDCLLDRILERVAESMLTASECQPSELTDQVRNAFERLREDDHGTPIPENND